MCQQLAVFEYGGLAHFLTNTAGPALIRRADRIEDWVHAPMGFYRIDEARAGSLLVTDLATREQIKVLDVGAFTERWPGSTVVSRVVPVDVEPGLMFESRPLDVDEETARDGAERLHETDSFAWVDALEAGRHAGRLEARFSARHVTPLGTDIVPDLRPGQLLAADGEVLPGRMRELIEAGISPLAANGVCVCEVVLIAAKVAPRGVDAAAPHLAAVLQDRAVYDAAKAHLVDPENAGPWRLVADSVAEPVRGRCLALAQLCA